MKCSSPRIPTDYPKPIPANPADSPLDPDPGKNDPGDPGRPSSGSEKAGEQGKVWDKPGTQNTG